MLLLSTGNTSMLLKVGQDVSFVPTCQEFGGTPTVAAGLSSKQHLIQVTPKSIIMWADVGDGSTAASWTPESGTDIIAASVSDDVVIAASRGGLLYVLSASHAGFTLSW